MARKLGLNVASILLLIILAPAGVVWAGVHSRSPTVCRSWAHKTSPNGGTGDNVLNGGVATSASNAWAVGGYFGGAETGTLIGHWDGNSWSAGSSPNVGT